MTQKCGDYLTQKIIINEQLKFSINDNLLLLNKPNFVIMETVGLKMIRLQHLLFWASFLFITSYISLKAYPWSIALLRVTFVSCMNVALYIFCYHYLVNNYIEKNKFFQFVFIVLGLLLISVALRYNFDKGISHYRIINGLQPFKNKMVLLWVSFFTQAIVMLIACLLSISANRFVTERKLLEAAKKQSEMELTMLKTKISPHFLLNALNNIYYYSQQAEHNTSNAILKLSYLLQYVSYEVALKRITLERELEIMYALKDIYNLRFEKAVQIEFTIDNLAPQRYEILPGILVTLFENALKHSGVGIVDKAWIKVNIQNLNGVFTFSILNSTNKDLGKNNTLYSGIGLASVREMLEIEYGAQHNLIIHQTENSYDVKLILKA